MRIRIGDRVEIIGDDLVEILFDGKSISNVRGFELRLNADGIIQYLEVSGSAESDFEWEFAKEMFQQRFSVGYHQDGDWIELWFDEEGNQQITNKPFLNGKTGKFNTQIPARPCKHCGEEIEENQLWCLKYHNQLTK